MQYQVPQFIDLEDRIIGPLTLKQFLYLAFASAVLFVLWFIFKFFLWVIFAIPITALALAFAFLKINDRPFVYFFLSFINYQIKPKLYLFSTKREKRGVIAESKPSFVPQSGTSADAKALADKSEGKKITRSKLKELALNLNIGGKNRP